MKIKTEQIIELVLSGIILLISLFFIGTRFFVLLFGIGIIVGALPFVLEVLKESRREKEREEMFLEFARNLVESVKTGTPISKSIINSRGKNYGILTSHVEKLANQIQMGFPLSSALQTFSKDVNNIIVSRAITLIGQAEKAGGHIGQILESVVEAVNTTDKLKKERKASISNLIIQGYIVFFVFMGIVLIMQFKIIPILSGMSTMSPALSGGVSTGGSAIDPSEISNAFLFLLVIQGAFSGLAIGMLSEGNIKAGIKHSFALVVAAILVSSIAGLFMA
ncbi:MAG: type II secretion system F family protein [archaeon]